MGDSQFNAKVLMSSSSASQYKTKWMHRQNSDEDPQLGLEDYVSAEANGGLLYAEGELGGKAATMILPAHQGANMFIRKFSPPMVTYLNDIDDQAWTNNEITSTGAGKVHGLWGSNPGKVSRTFNDLPGHTELRIKAKYWAIDSWDGEWGYMYVDGVEQWKGKRSGAHSCTPDFNSYSGSFPNPWGGDKSGHKCFHLIDVTIAHTASYFKLEFKTSINQGESDEAWGFSNVQLSLDSNCLLPTALGLEDGGLP